METTIQETTSPDELRAPAVGETFYRSLSRGGGLEIRENSEGSRVVFKINSAALDRHGTVIEPGGVDLANYKNNPVVKFEHGLDRSIGDRVIGRATNVQHKDGALIAEVEFDSEDPVAADIERKVRQGFLNATSIGFRALEREWREVESDTDDPFKQLVFTRTELLEFSVVSVPSNPEALVEARRHQDTISELRTELRELTELVRSTITNTPAPEGSADDEQPEAPETSEPAAPEVPAVEATPRKRAATADDYQKLVRGALASQPLIQNEIKRILGRA